MSVRAVTIIAVQLGVTVSNQVPTQPFDILRPTSHNS
jgi:hypothetical protein